MNDDNIEMVWRKVMNSSADNCPMDFARALVSAAQPVQNAAEVQFSAAARAFAEAHIASDAIERIDEDGEREVSDVEYRVTDAKYNVTKRRLVEAYKALSPAVVNEIEP